MAEGRRAWGGRESGKQERTRQENTTQDGHSSSAPKGNGLVAAGLAAKGNEFSIEGLDSKNTDKVTPENAAGMRLVRESCSLCERQSMIRTNGCSS